MNIKRSEGKAVSHLALVIAAYLRVASEYPALNRFVVNKRIYQHNDFTVSMVVLRPGEDNDTMSKISLDFGRRCFRRTSQDIKIHQRPTAKTTTLTPWTRQ